jgi:catechol 2,3-dioxygenase-like lactoylglutathione lyase family enzyme
MTAPLPIQGLHHLSLVARDAERSAAFYRDVMGFRDLRRPPFSFRGAWLFGFGFQIHIIENAAAAEATARIDTRANHTAFRVTNLDEVRERLVAQGIEFHEQTNAGGARQVFFRDPDGHQIELAVYEDPAVGWEGSE